ncbi:hypothetical protein AA0Y32_06075 [Georgenia phoenicis]|uniref:hypothetical protein n=1 Tax=unclassified Georgenia TaxID=2626815 RepID=UPI0039B04681
MAITGRVRIDLSTIPAEYGMPTLGHDRDISTKLSPIIDNSDLASHIPLIIDVGSLRPFRVHDGIDAHLWAELACRFDNICIESPDPANVELWVAALRAVATERSAVA